VGPDRMIFQHLESKLQTKCDGISRDFIEKIKIYVSDLKFVPEYKLASNSNYQSGKSS
jgi:hypothetical protein